MKTSFFFFLLFFCALFFVPVVPARAAVPPPTCDVNGGPGDSKYCTRELAYSACMAHLDDIYISGYAFRCVVSSRSYVSQMSYGSTNNWNIYGSFGWVAECLAPLVWNDETKKCEGDKDCSNEPDIGENSFITNDTSSVCSNGCKFTGAGSCVGVVLDGVNSWYCTNWKSLGEACPSGSSDTPPSPNDSDGDGSSDGNDSSPNNPGSGNPNQPQDGGGKGNGNGSGEGSGNGNTSGGGGSCSSPPASTGDAILAQIAYQTWATRCAIEGAKDGNGNLKTSNGSASGGGEGEGEGTNFGSSAPPADEPFDASEHQRFGIGLNSSMLDSEAIFGAGNCPVFTITIYQSTFSSSELPAWCDLLRVMQGLVLLFGAVTALRILMGNNS